MRNLYEECRDADLFGPIRVGNNVLIGANSLILPRVTIGNNVIIGCGAIVTKNIPDNCVAAGVPARVIETIDVYLAKHKDRIDQTKSLPPEKKKEYLMMKYANDDAKKKGEKIK